MRRRQPPHQQSDNKQRNRESWRVVRRRSFVLHVGDEPGFWGFHGTAGQAADAAPRHLRPCFLQHRARRIRGPVQMVHRVCPDGANCEAEARSGGAVTKHTGARLCFETELVQRVKGVRSCLSGARPCI